jgi:diaminopimelate decarboxylase
LRDHFKVTPDKHLSLHNVDLFELSRSEDTPLFVFDEDCLVKNLATIFDAFKSHYPNIIVSYSIKTNDNLAICKVMKDNDAYAEVASELDLYVAEKLDIPGERIIFDGGFKPDKVIRKALERRILIINAESFTELERINKIANEMEIIQSVGLRISSWKPKIFLKNLRPSNLRDAVNCNPSSRFGFSVNDAKLVFQRHANYKNLRIEGLMVHPYHSAIETFASIIKDAQSSGIEIKYLNIGGGFDPGFVQYVNYMDIILDLIRQRFGYGSKIDERKSKASDIWILAKHITDKVKELGLNPMPTIISEPGTFIVRPAGLLLVKVDHVKISGGNKWVIVDGGKNIVPAANVLVRQDVVVANKMDQDSLEVVNIIGPNLFNDDVLALNKPLPLIEEGDVLAIFDCGAYSLTNSTQLLYPRPAAVMINSKSEVKKIRDRETCDNVIYKDIM